MSALIDLLHEIKGNFRKGAYLNEASVRAQIVLPVLAKLGWSITDPSQIVPEYPLKSSKRKKGPAPKVDLALFNLSDTNAPQGIIELKRPENTSGDEQIFEYAYHTGATTAVLTNGKSWRFYYLQPGGSYDDRLIRTLEIEEHDLEEMAKSLIRYLSFKNFQSGKAIEYAQRDQSQRKNQMRARDAIPHAWDKLTEGGADSRLAKLLIQVTSSISGYAPQDEDVMAFILSLRDRDATAFIRPAQTPFSRGSRASDELPKKRHRSSEKKERRAIPDDAQKAQRKSIDRSQSGKSLTFIFKGESHEAKSQIDAYARIIELMEQDNPGFLDVLAPELSFSKTKMLARSKDDLASQEIFEKGNVAVQIVDGWWLYTKINRGNKIRNLEIACRVAGISFGTPDGLLIDF
ncbi:MAG: type I restriction enzyme HsdR N-terminal domain-containing protein [Ectothiorhodospiraceae bacterium AqS1]|nr:type I restriction enzyme HsdR N-terminal domain-containing protein [Ectothiorhodospiraceae bacterium AqS1]MBF2761031.1 type I restriction enzyme HsdR N-terminal domain-containing protein [Ectothiorhodospiraceae bacterium AqS1]